MQAIAAIELYTDAIGYNNGDLILHNKADKKKFVEKTKDKTMIVGNTTYKTLPSSVKARDLIVIGRKNVVKMVDFFDILPDTSDFIVIGGAMTYKTFEHLIDTWYVTWFESEVDIEKAVCYHLNIEGFSRDKVENLDHRVNFYTYRKHE